MLNFLAFTSLLEGGTYAIELNTKEEPPPVPPSRIIEEPVESISNGVLEWYL